jgi:hypothetical protein
MKFREATGANPHRSPQVMLDKESPHNNIFSS